jgi:hypothetical protein
LYEVDAAEGQGLRLGGFKVRKARALPWTRWGRRPQTPFIKRRLEGAARPKNPDQILASPKRRGKTGSVTIESSAFGGRLRQLTLIVDG